MSTELLIRCCAPTLAGLKTGSMYACPYDTRETLLDELRRLNRLLSPRGLRILPLRFGPDRALLYLFRPEDLARDLQCPHAQKILAEAGYEDLRPEKCMRCLIERLQNREDFPHEIGLFLSYPPEDVRGFIRYGGSRSKLTGCWQVYGDAEAARKTFERFDKCTRIYCRRWAEGVPLTRLAVAGV